MKYTQVSSLVAIVIGLVFMCGLQPVQAAPCPPCTKEYGYVGLNSLVRSTPDVIGSKAHISFHNVELCNEDVEDPSEPLSRPYNHSTAWTMVIGKNPLVSSAEFNVYIQTGWMRFNDTLHSPRDWIFLESGKILSNGTYVFSRWEKATPAPSGTKEYKVEQSHTAGGQWKVYYNAESSPWKTVNRSEWEDTVGKQARNKGEVNILESDMPGTSGQRCVLKNLKYKLVGNSGYVDQETFPQSNSTDNSRWGHNRVSSSHVEIWDKNDDCD